MSKENIILGLQHKLQAGECVTFPPLGYETIKVRARTKYDYGTQVVVNEKTKNIVIDLFETYATGNYSYTKLEAYIQNKYPGQVKVVHNILKNKFYIGIMTFKGKEYPHKYPCFISKELFDKVEQIRNTNTRYILAADLKNEKVSDKKWKRSPTEENASLRAQSIRRGQIHKVLQGEFPCLEPLGYKRIDTGEKKHKKKDTIKEIAIDPEAAPIIKDIFTLYARFDFTILKVKEYIQQRYSLSLDKKTIGRILKNKFYIGIMLFRGLEYPHKYPKIIDEELFNACQAKLAKHNFYLAKEFREKLIDPKEEKPKKQSLNQRVLQYCAYQKSYSDMQKEFKLEADKLNTLLFELELDNKIKEVQPRMWQTI